MRRACPVLLAAALLAPAARGEEPAPAPTFTARLLLSYLEPLQSGGERQAELFYAAVRGAFERKGFGARAELRAREERFREYYPGQVWLEEGYGFVSTPAGEVRMGKLERAVGLPDESFGGTLFSLNGVTRNPDWGAGLDGHRDLGHDTLSWSAAYLGKNDHVAWELDGRGVESDPAAELKDALSARVTYRWAAQFPWLAITPGVSGETARVERDAGAGFRRNDLALELTCGLGPLSLGLEAFWRSGERAPERLGYGSARAWLASFTAEFPNVVWRYVYSDWTWLANDGRESQHVVAATWSPRKGIAGTIELAARRFRDAAGSRSDDALRFGLELTF